MEYIFFQIIQNLLSFYLEIVFSFFCRIARLCVRHTLCTLSLISPSLVTVLLSYHRSFSFDYHLLYVCAYKSCRLPTARRLLFFYCVYLISELTLFYANDILREKCVIINKYPSFKSSLKRCMHILKRKWPSQSWTFLIEWKWVFKKYVE